MIILGAFMAAFSVACILLPNDAIDYGTAGIAIIVSKLTGLHLSVSVFLIFLPFLILGGITMGKNFLIKAISGSAAYMIGLEIFEAIPFQLNVEHFLAVAFGGAILGGGLSIILRRPKLFGGEERHVADALLFLQTDDGIEKVDKQILVGFRAKKALEAEVRDEIDVMF